MSDLFWRRRTEDAGGLLRRDSELPEAAAWRRWRLSQELTDRHYHRWGLMPAPATGDEIAVVTGDCEHPARDLGRLADKVYLGADNAMAPLYDDIYADGGRRYPDGYGWTEWADRVESWLDLDEGVHDDCLHRRPGAMFPLMWQVGLLLRTADNEPGAAIRTIRVLSWDDVVRRVPAAYGIENDLELKARWVMVRTRTAWCALSPAGLAYRGDTVADLAAAHRAGAGPGELAAMVEGLGEIEPDARLARRAGLPTARLRPGLEVPDGLTFFASDDDLVVVASLDAPAPAVDAALAYGIGLAADRDVTLILPEGREGPTMRRAPCLSVRVRVWLHDGCRVTPAPLPARIEVYTHYRAQSWSVLPPETPWDTEQETLLAADGWDAGLVRVRRRTRCGPATAVLGARAMPDHIVTLTRPAPTALLEALDQMVWAESVAEELDAIVPDAAIFLAHRVVVAAGALHPTAPALLEAFDLAPVRLRMPGGGGPERLPAQPVCDAPTAGPRPAPARSGHRRTRRIAEVAAEAGAENDVWPDPMRALLPPARSAYAATEQHDGISDGFPIVTSAQAFAMNVFAPVGAEGAARVCDRLGLPVAEAGLPVFGHRVEGFPATVIDVLLAGTAADGRRVAALLLVRLTEEELGRCAGHPDPANPRRDACRANAPFGGDHDACHLLRRENIDYPRLLDLAGPPLASGWWTADGGCPFRRAAEPMRALALGEAVRARHTYDEVAVALCSPAEGSIRRRWQESQATLRSAGGLTLSYLPLEVVLAATRHPAADWIRERYGLGSAERV